MYEGKNEQVFERSAEMFLYVDCPSLESKEIREGDNGEGTLVGAVIRNVVVDVYFHPQGLSTCRQKRLVFVDTWYFHRSQDSHFDIFTTPRK